jgi:superfamily II DNA or RNA helicase
MSQIWGNLGKSKLQSLIGGQTIGRLESLLPGLLNGFDPNTLHQKSGLVSVFEAFHGAEALENSVIRAELFNSLPPATIQELAKIAELPNGLPIDEKIKKLTKITWTNNDFAKQAAVALKLPDSYVPEERRLVPSEELLSQMSPRYKPLKEYQFPVAFRARDKLKIAHSRFVIQMPTGSGKTRTAIEVICNFLNEVADGTVVVWLAHSEELCQQAFDSFKEIWPHVAESPLRLIRTWGNNPPMPYDFSERALIVAGFAKLYGLLQKEQARFDALRQRVQLIVVDEAHKVTAPTYEAVTRALMGNSTRVIGLTATPGRSALNTTENAALAEFFFNNLITIETDGKPVIPFLRRQGVLSEVIYEPLRTQRSYTLSAGDKLHLEKFFDLPPGFLLRLAEDDIRNVEILKRLEKEANNGHQILFFACSVEHSKFICALLKFLGVAAEHIDGSTPPHQRSSILEGFKRGSVNVLCNYGVLSTGFDAPKTDLVFISRPTASIVLYSQMIGRGLRGPAIGGTETCKIIDVIDNISDFSDQNSVYSFFDEYFSRGS